MRFRDELPTNSPRATSEARRQPSLTIAEMCKLNLERASKQNRRPGLHAYECHSRHFIKMWGGLSAQDLSRQDIIEWVRDHESTYSPATVKHRLGFLSSAFNTAIEKGLLDANPTSRIKLKAKIGQRHQWLSLVQEAQMKQAYLQRFDGMGELFWGAERFAILTGCRLGEQAWLKPHHVSKQVLKIPTEGKTGTRLVPMHPEAYKIAQDWLAFSQLFSASEFIFWPVAGERNVVAAEWTRTVWNMCREDAELADYQRRDLRRTFGSRLVQAGEPIYNVMKLLGHSSPQMTERYCQLDLMHLAAGVLRLV